MTLDFYGPGELIGLCNMISLHADDADDALVETAKAKCYVSTLRLPDTQTSLSPDDVQRFYFEVHRQLKRMTLRAIVNTLYGVAERLKFTLVDLAERFGTRDQHRDGGVIDLNIDILQTDLAFMIGSRPETVCRIIKELERQGIIASKHNRGNITILDIERLKQSISSEAAG